MNELAYWALLINKWKLKYPLEWIFWLYKQWCLVLSCIAPWQGCSSLIVAQYSLMYKSGHSTWAALTFLYTNMPAFPCRRTVSAASVLWVWSCPNDWQARSSSCKSGSGTRVELLHLSWWIHICTAHSNNYNSPSVCIYMCVCLCANGVNLYHCYYFHL